LPQANSEAQARDQTDEPRRRSVDNAELNEMARMMPDPAEDEMFDNGTLFTPPFAASQVGVLIQSRPQPDPRA